MSLAQAFAPEYHEFTPKSNREQGHYQLNHLPPLALLTKPADILPRSCQVETFGAPVCRRHPGRYSQTPPARFGLNALPGTGCLQSSEREPTYPCGCLPLAFDYAFGLSCHSMLLMASITFTPTTSFRVTSGKY